MSVVDVEIAEDRPGPQPEPEDGGDSGPASDPDPRAERRQRRARTTNGSDVEIEKEVTKRELIRTVSNVLIMILYMVFTLLRDRDAGVVVLDGGEADDWE